MPYIAYSYPEYVKYTVRPEVRRIVVPCYEYMICTEKIRTTSILIHDMFYIIPGYTGYTIQLYFVGVEEPRDRCACHLVFGGTNASAESLLSLLSLDTLQRQLSFDLHQLHLLFPLLLALLLRALAQAHAEHLDAVRA